VPGIEARTVALLTDPAEAPDSSLSHMVRLFGPATWHLRHGRVDPAGIAEAVRGPKPVFVAATSFALVDWLEADPPRLPAGSTVMVTGGFKGRRTEVEPEELWARVRERLAPARVVTEYGMTELSSQLWGTPELPYLPPPWLRVVAVDPEGRPVPEGVAGQLRFWDLVNLDGAVAVETLDRGRVLPGGAVELHGRMEGAVARGCSLTVEEAWALRTSTR
jgi:acyl-CoA synthetase (AMP-forming)/AMP-acid ligase II